MKAKKVIEIETDNIAEEQYVLNEFPDALWIALDKKTKFYVPYNKNEVVNEILEKWEKVNK